MNKVPNTRINRETDRETGFAKLPEDKYRKPNRVHRVGFDRATDNISEIRTVCLWWREIPRRARGYGPRGVIFRSLTPIPLVPSP